MAGRPLAAAGVAGKGSTVMASHGGSVEAAVACRLLGPIEMAVGDVAVDLGGGQRRAVMALLALAEGRSVSETALIESLWGDDASGSARNNLQSHVSRLRAAMARAGLDGAHELLRRTHDGYRLDLSPEQVDIGCVRAGIARARQRRRRDPAGAADLLSESLSLWRGQPLEEFVDLPGWTTSGMAAAQASLEQLRSTIREGLFDARLAAGAHVETLPGLEQMAAEEPLREPVHRLLAIALYRSDRAGDALDVLRRFRHRLADEAGLDPSEEVAALEQAILRGDEALRAETAPPSPSATLVPRRPQGWLRGAAPLCGRTTELSALLDHLDHGDLVTITGPGGVGKSRLAMEAIARVDRGAGAHGEHPVVVLELAALHNGDALVPALARAVGVGAAAHSPLEDVLLEYLASRRLLVVLDNCEHVLADTAAFVGRLLGVAGDVTVLATSRERLGLPIEQVLPLGPLPTATTVAGRVPTSDGDRDPVSAATELFVARARRIQPSFALTDGGRQLVDDLCRQLDGLPLAIELAASQLGTLGLADLHDRLPERLDLLSRPRHSSLRDVINRSYQLLEPHERDMFERLAVFDGGFTLDAATRVAARAGGPVLATQTLSRLVDASMVAVTGDGRARLRYRLLETLRLHARERLTDRGTLEETERRHIDWVVEFAETAERQLDGPDEVGWVDRVEAEFDNIRTAWHAAVRRGDLTSAARITVALAGYAQIHGQAELWAMAKELVGHPALPDHPLAVAVHGAAAQAHYREGDLAACARLVDAGDAMAARHADEDDVARRWWLPAAASVVALFRGDHEASERLSAAALTAAGTGASPTWRTLLIGDIALARSYAGNRDGARAAVRDCADAANASGLMTARAWAHYVDGEVTLPDDPARAVVALDAAVDLARAVGATFVEGVAMVSLLSAAIRAEDHARAIDAVPGVIDHWQRFGGMWTHQWTTLRVVAELLGAVGVDDSALILLAAADAAGPEAPAVTGPDAARADALRARLRHRLGERRFTDLMHQGAMLSRTEAVNHALVTAVPRAAAAVVEAEYPGQSRTVAPAHSDGSGPSFEVHR